MPELPEVETVKRGLEKLIVGKTISSITHDWEKSFPNDPVLVNEFVIKAEIKVVKRRAKVLLIELSTGYTLMTHLKMTGQLVFVAQKQTEDGRLKTGEATNTKNPQSSILNPQSKSDEVRFGAGHPNDSLVNRLPDKSTRVDITFTDGSHLYFNDQRKFGWMKLFSSYELDSHDFLSKLGPEPLEAEFTYQIFVSRVRRRSNSNIKAVILDQTVLAGVGNIYADESLWGAKIHPATLVKNLSDKKLVELHSEIIYVLNLSIEKGGSTDRNYVNAEGKKGSYIDFARVFRRENLPCPRCESIIVKTRVAGRGTHLCPKCQKV
jgi:formamidopyrimidine-DNA glycosylase